MKTNKTLIAVLLISTSILCSSCIGSFKLWNGLKEWNQGIGNKFVNELVFIALNIVPVYGVAYFADVVVLNTIEFWSGSNPVASNEVKEVKGENGNYLVASNENGYTITNKEDNQSLDLVYNKENKSWNAVTESESFELVKMNDDGTATINMQNGTSMTVTPDSEGIASVRAASMGVSFALR
jgi:hypothetical protein